MTEPRKLRQVSPDPLRETLRKLITERNAAKDVCTNADLAERAGLELLAAAEKRLEDFGDVDDAILQHRAARYKDAAKGGPKPSLALPEDLLKREHGRDEAASAVAAAEHAHCSLLEDFEAAQQALQRAGARVSEATGAILGAEANRLAAALQAAWTTTWFLYDVLSALPVPLPRDAVDVCQEIGKFDYRQFAGGRNQAVARAAEDWRTWMAALSEDADASPLKLDNSDSSATVERVA